MSAANYVDTLGPLPKADRNAELQRRSINALVASLPADKFLFRDERADDAGVDASLELLINSLYTNVRAQVQLKSTDSQDVNGDGTVSLQIKTSNLNYLLNGQSPLYILYVAPRSELRFVWARDEHKRFDQINPEWMRQDTIAIRFEHHLTPEALGQIHQRIWQEAQVYRRVHDMLTKTPNKELGSIKEATQVVLESGAQLISSVPSFSQEITSFLGQKADGPPGLAGSDVQALVLTTEYQAEIDYSRDLQNASRFKDCIEYLERLKNRIWSSAQPIVKFRILTNIGAAKFKLDQDQEAARLFLEALQYNPEDEKALGNAALGHLLLGQAEEAARFAQRVLEKNPSSGIAYCLIVQIPAAGKKLENTLAKVPEAYRTSPEVAYALGRLAYNEGNYSDAKTWFETAIRNDKEDLPDLRASLGALLMELVWRDRSFVFAGQLDDAQRKLLDEAVRLLTSAWDRVADTDFRRNKPAWILNRGIAKKLLGDLDGAVKDMDAALQIAPSNPIFIKHRAVLAYESGDSRQAITLLERVLQSKEIPEAPLVFADMLRAENRLAEAINVVQPMLNSDLPHALREEATRLLIRLLIDARELEKAERISEEMRASNPTDILNLVDASQIAGAYGNSEDAISFLEEAKNCITESSTHKQLLALGDEFYALNRYEDAAGIYEKIVDTDFDTYLTRKLLNCYYRFGKLGPALEICRSLRSRYGPLQFVSKMESAIFEEINDLPKAKEVCQQYLQSFPGDIGMMLRLAVVNLRSKEYEELDSFLDSKPSIETLLLEDGLQLSDLYAVRSRVRDCFETIYEIRRRYFNHAAAHLEYVRLFFEREKDDHEWLGPTEVAANVAVCLADAAGQQEWFIVEDRKDADIQRREINSEHLLAQRLMGKSPEDEVIIKKGLHSEELGKIVELKSKYVYALHETLSMYEKMFPGAGGLWQTHVGEPEPGKMSRGFQDMLQIVSRKHETNKEIEQYYLEGKLTIGSIANLLHVDVFKVWNGLTGNADVGIRCCQGSGEETNHAFSLLSGNKPRLVVDMISLLTIHGLNVGDVVIRVFGKLRVAQTTIDLLQGTIRDLRSFGARGFMAISKEGERYVRQEVTANYIIGVVEYLKKLTVWVDENCEVTPSKAALNIVREHRGRLNEMLGAAFVDTILIASEGGNLLFSDDELLRSFAKREHGVDGVWTQILLLSALKEKAIDSSHYTEAVLSLVCSHYYHTSINADVLIEAARKAGWAPAYPYTNALKLLGEKRSDESSALNVAIAFLYELWKQPILPERRDYLIYSLLDAVTAGRNRRRTISKVTEMVKARFLLLPLEERRVTSLIALWQQLHIM